MIRFHHLKISKFIFDIFFLIFLLLFVISKKDLLFQLIGRDICEHDTNDFNKMVWYRNTLTAILNVYTIFSVI